eukprot:TRINITY_DN3260_c0_g2_i1.p1 TRINITY_DN3260_c0_g2~~TRINITY_DN3260_c0_g2_i1.p1  ORF type:complete len:483 (+),score=106.41 TRINITY_DN3260_c0_g2_i1:129-1451(+)
MAQVDGKEPLEVEYENAAKLSKEHPDKAIFELKQIVDSELASPKIKEQSIYKIAETLADHGRGKELATLLHNIRPFFDNIAKAKTAKIVRSIIDLASKIPNSERLQIDLCRDSIQWCKDTNRSYLRQRIETKLYSLLYEVKEYTPALQGLTNLLWEVKRLDDKPLLVEIQLIESRIQHAVRNLPKARASLTSARTSANAIYCPPLLQAEIDMQSGILHAEEKDYKTAYSYFFEAFEGYNSLDDPLAISALKYMLLSRVMTNNAEDVQAILGGKTALKYHGRDLDAMRAVAKAHTDRSLKSFEGALTTYKAELTQDPIIHTHISELYNTLLEQNLQRIIEPFSCVEIEHIAKLIQLPVHTVEKKLSNMILDHKFDGILDQGKGTLVVYDEPHADKTYPTSLEAIQTLSRVVDALYEKASKKNKKKKEKASSKTTLVKSCKN